MKLHTSVVTIVGTLLLAGECAFAQGPLAPPAPPGPTMKTLDQLEPRKEINATIAPGNADTEHVITQPGSYYLSGNLAVNKTVGIRVDAAGVTLDLNGFEISRAANPGGTAIEITATSHRATVKNGSINGAPGTFDYGVHALSALPAQGGAFLDLAVTGCTSTGMIGGGGWRIDKCVAHDNGASGIRAGRAATVTKTVAYENTGSGIITDRGSTLSDCSAYENGVSGFEGGTASTLHNCSSTQNGRYGFILGLSATITNCLAYFNTNIGIYAGQSGTITNCAAYGNEAAGISVQADSLVSGNVATNNIGAGIAATSSRNRIEGNNVSGNDVNGIHVTAVGNLILRNSASGNTPKNYEIVANNRYGEIVDLTAPNTDAPSGNAATGTLAGANTWANFAY